MTKTTHTSLRALATRGALAGSILAIGSTAAMAGGLDRSGQGVGVIFKDGNYAELSAAFVTADVTGEDDVGTATGDVAEDYISLSGSVRYEINDQLSISAIIDEPYGADIEYPDGSKFGGTIGQVDSLGVAAIARYKLNDTFSVHGGARYFTLENEALFSGTSFGSLNGYTHDSDGSGTAFIVGGAYEIPAIALRVAVTYTTEADVDLDTSENSVVFNTTLGNAQQDSTTKITTPARIRVDFQTGVAEDTLVFGYVQHVAWDGFEVAPRGLASAGQKLVDLESDAITYNVGLGRRLSDELSIAGTITYEADSGGKVSALAPNNGTLQFGLGGTYRVNEMIEVAGGASYILPGDADIDTGDGGKFQDNSAIGLGARVGIYF